MSAYLSNNKIRKDIIKVKEKFANVLGGELSSLETSSKTTFVDAINELYLAIDDLLSSVLTGLKITGENIVIDVNSTYICEPIPSKAEYNGVTWSISVGSAATISNNGVLTIKNTAWNDIVTIKAVSNDNSSISATKNIVVSYPMSVEIAGDNTINKEGQFLLNVTPAKASDETFTWSIIEGSTYATITQNGLVTVNEGVESKSITIKVSSEYGSATKIVTVSNVEAKETILFQVTTTGNHEYTQPIMAQNTGLTDWTVLMDLSCNGVGSAACWVDDGANITEQFPQNSGGGFSIANYTWGAANFSMCLGGNWIVGSEWNPSQTNANTLKYAITRSGNTVKYSTDGTTWTTVNVSSWNNTGQPLTVGSSYGDKNAVPSAGKINFILYDTSELSADTLNNFFK